MIGYAGHMEQAPATGLRHRFRTMDKRLRLMLLSTALLAVVGIGQFMGLHDLGTGGKVSDVTFLFMVAGVFFVPTAIILTSVILYTIRGHLREHEKLALLGGLNLLLSVNLIWFFVSACSWASVFGLVLKSCAS
jgi:hypothetical protein